MQQGLLTDRVYGSVEDIPAVRRRSRHFQHPDLSNLTMKTVERVQAICKAHGVSTAEAAIAWSVAHPHISCTIVGARNEEQVGAEPCNVGMVVDRGKSLMSTFVSSRLLLVGERDALSRAHVDESGAAA